MGEKRGGYSLSLGSRRGQSCVRTFRATEKILSQLQKKCKSPNVLTLSTALSLLSNFIGANLDPVQRLNLVLERYLKSTDCTGSLELVQITVTADSDGQGFIELPERYQAIRGAVETTISGSFCRFPLPVRNTWYEYTTGNLGMLKGSDPMRGIIPIPKAEGDTLTRYKVPVCPAVGSNAYFTCICKLAFLFLENDSDVLPVQNVGALKLGLKALDKEDAEDYVRAEQLWNQGKTLLAQETDNEVGTEALGKMNVEDDWDLGCLGFEGGYGGYY